MADVVGHIHVSIIKLMHLMENTLHCPANWDLD